MWWMESGNKSDQSVCFRSFGSKDSVGMNSSHQTWNLGLVVCRVVKAPPGGHTEMVPNWHTTKFQRQSNAMFTVMPVKGHTVFLPFWKEKMREDRLWQVLLYPIKGGSIKETLTHLELIGARLGNNLLKPLNIDRNQLHIWTDSVIVLHWVRSTAQRWKPFVVNRVTEIQALTNPKLWFHYSGKTYPAYLPTRGQSVHSVLLCCQQQMMQSVLTRTMSQVKWMLSLGPSFRLQYT